MKIENQKLNIKEGFKNFYYIVPAYQREYIWTEKHVTQLLDDINDEFSLDDDSEYFIGSIVVNKNDDGTYEVIDGQQRLTTLYLSLCVFKKAFTEQMEYLYLVKGLLSSPDINTKGEITNNPRLLLQYEDSSEVLQKLLDNENVEDNLFGASNRIKDAYYCISEYINSNFSEDAQLKKFYGYFTNKVHFIQIETPTISDALKIFETINERGVGLNPMDLLKNLIFRQLDKNQFNKLNNEWKIIKDALDKAKIKPLRFLRYFLMANYNINDPKGTEAIYEEQIYDWIRRNDEQCQYSSKPIEFVRKLQDNAKAYATFLKGEDFSGKNIYLENIRNLGGGSFSLHLIILLAAKDLPHYLLGHLISQLEVLIFYYNITRTSTKELERRLSRWANIIRPICKLSDEEAKSKLNEFIINNIQPVIDEMENDFHSGFLNLSTKSLQGYKIKYILAKLTAHVDTQRIGATDPVSILAYLHKKNEIEHILPQNPEVDLLESFGTEEEYNIYKIKLGSLTLLEKPINVVAGRKFFEEKLKYYKDSKFYLTKTIAVKEEIGVNSSISRINKQLLTFSEWNKEAIERRQEMLFNLAKKIWNIHTL